MVKNLQETSTYLENQIKSNNRMALVFLAIGLITLRAYIGVIFIIISIYFFIKASNYKKGNFG